MNRRRTYYVLIGVVLCIIIIASIINTKKEVSDIIEESFPTDKLFIKESFNGSTSTVKVDEHDIKRIYKTLLESKYVKEEEYKPEIGTIFEIYENNDFVQPILVFDIKGVTIGANNYTKYVLADEDSEELLIQLRESVEKFNRTPNSVNESDFAYLQNKRASEVSIFKLLERMNIDYTSIEINMISTSISSSGYFNSITIEYNDLILQKKFRVKYDHVEKSLSIKEQYGYNTSTSVKNYTYIILKSLDSLLSNSNKWSENTISRLIELHSPLVETININDKIVFYNNEKNTESEISGIIYTLYDQYSTEINEMRYYVFDK